MTEMRLTLEEVIAEIDELIRLRSTRSPSIKHLMGWKEFILARSVIPEHLPLNAYEAAERAFREMEMFPGEDMPMPLEAAIKAFLSVFFDQISLKPCPFCRKPLTTRSGLNPLAKCTSQGCWMAARQIAIPVDDPEQVRAWNDRGEVPA